MRRGDRPKSQVTPEEWQIFLTAASGRRRIVTGGSLARFDLPPGGEPALVAQSYTRKPLYVLVRPLAIPCQLSFGPDASTARNGAPVAYAALTPDQFTDFILLEGESVFVANRGVGAASFIGTQLVI